MAPQLSQSGDKLALSNLFSFSLLFFFLSFFSLFLSSICPFLLLLLLFIFIYYLFIIFFFFFSNVQAWECLGRPTPSDYHGAQSVYQGRPGQLQQVKASPLRVPSLTLVPDPSAVSRPPLHPGNNCSCFGTRPQEMMRTNASSRVIRCSDDDFSSMEWSGSGLEDFTAALDAGQRGAHGNELSFVSGSA